MEIYKGTIPTAEFAIPDGGTVTARFTKDGENWFSPIPEVADGVASISLGYMQYETNVLVEWSFTLPQLGSFTEEQRYTVVTPYLTLRELQDVVPHATDSERMAVESVTRHIINAHTGQSFGRRDDSLIVEGHGETALALPERLARLTGVSTLKSNLDPLAMHIISDGWYLKKTWANEIAAIVNNSKYWDGYTPNNALPGQPGYLKLSHGNIIVAPGSGGRATIWRDDYPFTITGTWGYDVVPYPVKEAARLLASDYACADQAYKDKYLRSIRAADWRLEFNARAWLSTGNYRVDMLLSEYIRTDWAVI